VTPETPERSFLGKRASVLIRHEVYVRPEGFEVDERSLISFRRSWILFDEVQLVTLHPARAWAGAILAGFFGVIFAGAGALILAFEKDTPEVSLFPFAFAALFLVIALIALVVPRWTVTLQGLRSRAAMTHSNRGKAQELYDQAVRLISTARERQETTAPPGSFGPEAPPEPPVLAYEPS
jgi:hypothetical protein